MHWEAVLSCLLIPLRTLRAAVGATAVPEGTKHSLEVGTTDYYNISLTRAMQIGATSSEHEVHAAAQVGSTLYVNEILIAEQSTLM